MLDKPGLRASAILLAAAGGVEYGLQMAMPIVLVRFLDATAFGQYRMLWLLASTALALAPAYMPQALFYFLPRAAPGAQRKYVLNVLIYLIAAACVAAFAVGAWNPLLPRLASNLFIHTHGVSTLFVGLWIVASLLDVLPSADGRARWQAAATVGIAIMRMGLLAGAAFLAGDIFWVVLAMVALAIVKICVMLFYVLRYTGRSADAWDGSTLRAQFRYALPFAVGSALFTLRLQADDWVVASMLTPAVYAVFSIAGVVLPVATLIRQPVYNAMMPYLNRAHARGDLAEMARLIGRSNGATAMVLIPVAGGLLAGAPELIDIVYTAPYRAAAPVMQLYLLGMMMNAFAVGHVLPALEKGRFAAVNNACCLVLSILLGIAGVHYFGFAGAALGSIVAFAMGEGLSLRVVARTLGLKVHALLQWHALLPVLLATGLAVASALSLTAGWEQPDVVMLMGKALIYVAVFAACFLLAGGRRHLGLLMGQYR